MWMQAAAKVPDVVEQARAAGQDLMQQAYWTEGLTMAVCTGLGLCVVGCLIMAWRNGMDLRVETHWGGLGGGVGGLRVSASLSWVVLALALAVVCGTVAVELSHVRTSLLDKRVALVTAAKAAESK